MVNWVGKVQHNSDLSGDVRFAGHEERAMALKRACIYSCSIDIKPRSSRLRYIPQTTS